MEMRTRPVAKADLARICTFPQSAEELFFLFPKASYPLTPEQLAQAIAARSDSTVVELAGQVVAFANFYQWQLNGHCAIGNVMVAPDCRGGGVGRHLIAAMAMTAQTKYHAHEVRVSCFNHNTTGLLFYARLGFHPSGIEQRSDGQGHPVALLHLCLPLATPWVQRNGEVRGADVELHAQQ